MVKARTPKRVVKTRKPQNRPRKGCPSCGSNSWGVNMTFNALLGVETLEAPVERGLKPTIDTGTRLIVQSYRCKKCNYLMFFQAKL